MNAVHLGDVLQLSYGRALKQAHRSGGPYPVVGSGGVVGRHDASLTTGPTVVVGRKGSIGSVTWIDGPAWPIDTAYFVEPLSPSLDLRWTYWALQSLGLAGMNKSAAIPGLNREDVYRLAIKLPALDEKRRIAAILDHADALRAKRLRVLAHLDDFTQSVFRDMFDTSTTNSLTLSDVAAVASGITKGRKAKEATQPVPYLAVANVQAGSLKLDSVKTIDATKSEIARYALADGDLVLTEGGDPDKLGRGTVWRSEIALCLHQNHVFRVRTDPQVVPEYLAAWLAAPVARRHFLRSAKQTTGIASINMTQLKATPVLVPPLPLQVQYAAIVARARDVARDVMRLAERDDELFASLQSRAFMGEL